MGVKIFVSAHDEEIKYFDKQSSQLNAQCGGCGYFIGSFTADGRELYGQYFGRQSTKTSFGNAGEVLNTIVLPVLHNSESFGTVLKSREYMANFCKDEVLSKRPLGPAGEVGHFFRFNTDNFAFLTLMRGLGGCLKQEIYIFAYISTWLDNHIAEAKNGTLLDFEGSRINSNFVVPDGGYIEARSAPEKVHRIRYIDSTHFEADNALWHTSQYANAMEKLGIAVGPRVFTEGIDNITPSRQAASIATLEY